METTFLAGIWGPILFAVGLGIFISRKYYVKIYQDLEKESLAVLLFGMVGMAGGIAQIVYHNIWSTFPEVVVSLLGWGLLAKGVVFIIAPGLIDRGGNWQVKSGNIQVVGILTLVLGVYLSWIGYFA